MNNYSITDNTAHSSGQPKMHINPHFKQTCNAIPHINPNFYSKLYNQANALSAQKIHVNPRFVESKNNKINNSVETRILTNLHNDNFLNHDKKNLDVPKTFIQCTPTTRESQSKYKFVNLKSQINSGNAVFPSSSSNNFDQDRCARVSVSANTSTCPMIQTSKYTLVRNNTVQTSTTASSNKTIQISRYKSVPISKILPKVENSMQRRTQVQVMPKVVLNRKIDRRLKETSKTKANTSILNKSNSLRAPGTSLITIRGQKFSATGKSLKLIGPKPKCELSNINNKLKVRVNGKIYIQKSQYLFVRKSAVVQDRKCLKKNNIPCPVFHKFGKCTKLAKGKCPLSHDKKHVAVCRKFLRGTCKDDHCLLSHEISLEKMPTCSFYLQGCCTRDNCPYLHVKVSDSALVCVDFVKGYCELGQQCMKRHVFLCPEYAKSGKCNVHKCPYPHKELSFKIYENEKWKSKAQCSKKIMEKMPDEDINNETKRYYVCSKTTDVENADSTGINEIHTSRCQLGTLPSFIKL